ncbi:MAG: sigma-70 family RNA polymerase sigma factor [Firmicutes bacterium]|nr:sigma-70 family RNA polymerase sigma factor [Bacillota bacterium]
MEDDRIIQLIQGKDQEGLQLLIKHYGPLIRYVVKPICGSDEGLTEDCIQEVLSRIWGKFQGFDPEKGSLKSWLTAAARNSALNMVRGKADHDSYEEIPEDVKSDSPGPEESAIKNAAAAAVRAAVEKLPEKDRLLVYRRYYYMQSVAQIAAETGLSERAAEGRLYRIRQKLAEMLKGYANE